MEGRRPDRGGRPATTSPHELAAAAQRLFIAKGFEQTSVEDIAFAVGVSRRTFFRYFHTKADVLWVESDAEIRRLKLFLAADNCVAPPRDVIEEALVAALRFHPRDEVWARHRAQLILSMPAVRGHAAALHRQLRDSITAYLRRRGIWTDDELFATAFAHATTAAIMTAHEYWLAHPETSLTQCLRSSIRLVVPAGPPATANAYSGVN